MSQGVDLVFVWHHHQPDYRRPRDGRAMLPWVRLHATKDYLDMALHLERHPKLKATFNFAPSLLEQIEHALSGGADALFELLAAPAGALDAAARAELQARTRLAPRWAHVRWPQYAELCRRLRAPAVASEAELLRLCVHFLLAWLDPTLLGEPAAAAADAALREGRAGTAERDALLALHAEVLARVLPAYRRLAGRGQVELTCSPAFHPILPLLVDVRTAKRSRPDLPLPTREFAAPEDARWQVERGLDLAARSFGARPTGMWPSEGGVSPEAAEILVAAGVRWAATDELVLWRSVKDAVPGRESLYRPWILPTPAGELALFFRDHELSDRIGFVYSTWDAAEATEDFLRRLRGIGEAHRAAGRDGRPVVSVILDGENCWEHYAEDGRPFLEALYAALAEADDIRTRTPSEVLADGPEPGRLAFLHSGSWIDADFHIWAGHPEKNRAWELLALSRAALVREGRTRDSHPVAWESLGAAEGSDWFWWFGEDNYTADKALFDSLFRAHLQAAHEHAGLPVPNVLLRPIANRLPVAAGRLEPTGLVRPVIDGHLTRFYEWHGAGSWDLAGGGSMHRVSAPLATRLHFGFDSERLYLRVDFSGGGAPGGEVSAEIEVLSPAPLQLDVGILRVGRWRFGTGGPEAAPPAGEAALEEILELALPFAVLGVSAGQSLELFIHLRRGGERLDSLPPGQPLRVVLPGADWEAMNWNV
ncbi:MAG: glycoside hydrolase [Candidatus Eisenbacteria bacterium]|nr:glycoside hydrolase [Candidatus Eisenbacteria bacterium]